jgi:hypothetical protein
MPLATALAIGRPTPAALALALAVVSAFLAHEPALVLLGQRGRRVREVEAPRARLWLAATGGLSAIAGVLGMALAPAPARIALALPVALAAVVLVLVLRRAEHTAGGEIVVAAAFASAGLAIALAAGATAESALAASLAWLLAFAAATLAVHVMLERVRSKGTRDPGRRHAALAALLAVTGAGLSLAGLPSALALAILPTVALSAVVCLARISPRRLRELGWALVGSSTLTLAILVAGLR